MMKVYIPGFIGKQCIILWCHGVTILLKLNCKYFKQPWFEWKSQQDTNFNMKNMKMIIDISIKICIY